LFTGSANADRVKVPNKITGYDGLGEGASVQITPGLHASDGTAEIVVYPGTGAGVEGHVVFKLNSTDIGQYQNCAVGYDYVWDPNSWPQASYWPLSSQIGRAGSLTATGEVKIYFRTPEPLVNGKGYLISVVCPPASKNPTQ
jgi:hypothetical protein